MANRRAARAALRTVLVPDRDSFRLGWTFAPGVTGRSTLVGRPLPDDRF